MKTIESAEFLQFIKDVLFSRNKDSPKREMEDLVLILVNVAGQVADFSVEEYFVDSGF